MTLQFSPSWPLEIIIKGDEFILRTDIASFKLLIHHHSVLSFELGVVDDSLFLHNFLSILVSLSSIFLVIQLMSWLSQLACYIAVKCGYYPDFEFCPM